MDWKLNNGQTGDLKLIRDCIDNEFPKIHEAFGAPGCFDVSRGEYVTKKEESTVEERALIHTNQFKYAVQSYMQDNTKHFKLKIEMEGKHTWQEVIECVKQADRYNEDSKGFHAKVRKVGRWTTRILPSGIDPSDPWLNLLPTDAYGCLVYGGLKVILTATARISTLRKRIMELLEDIADTMQELQEYLDLHPNDRRLVAAMTEYYIAILTAMGEMMAWSASRSLLKLGHAILPGKYARSLDDAMESVKKQRELLKRRRDLLLHTTTVDSARDIKGVQYTMENVGHSLAKATLEATINANDTIIGIERVETGVGRVEVGMGKIESALDVNNTMVKFLLAQLEKERWYTERIRVAEQAADEILQRERPNSSGVRSPGLSPAEISAKRKMLELRLNVPQNTASCEVKVIERWLKGTNVAEQSQGQWLLTASLFLKWFTAGKSQGLLVDGNCDYERISHVSYFMSTFLQSLQKIDGVHTIHFYCGLHDREIDPLSGTTGIMRSLISQLLALHEFTFVKLTRDQLNQIEYRSNKLDPSVKNERAELQVLCKIFCSLVAELPFNFILYCIVDGFSAYETFSKQENLRYVMKKLYSMTTEKKTEAIFKLLICTPDPSRHVKRDFPAQNRLEIPNLGDIDADGDQLTERDMHRVVSLGDHMH